jgi:hypothetical protein
MHVRLSLDGFCGHAIRCRKAAELAVAAERAQDMLAVQP